ncbi:unnamed protein product [Allacma fusca]|uniref:Uncharacterized protein n=1 Tax=Allacma fusca TaxID=39272 RepID=A0A8J2NGJ0_9HEXA|nr:unnamed protein product [Allacma fusca]
MGDCFPRTTFDSLNSKFPTSDACKLKTGDSEYKDVYKQWPQSSITITSMGDGGAGMAGYLKEALGECVGLGGNRSKYAFSKGPRFGIPPYCDCTPPLERSRFTTTYNNDFVRKSDQRCGPESHPLSGVKERCPTMLPPQYLCPLTTETTYSQAFDVSQPHFESVCSQQEACGGSCAPQCEPDSCSNPVQGITISFKQPPARRQMPPLNKDDLVKPGTDTTDCPRCPRVMPCCPCESSSRLCDACCACEYPCKLHQATTTPTRKYPIILGTPRYVPNPRDPPARPKLLCHGGTCECPLQSSFPTSAAVNQAQQRLLNKLEEERCVFPPECLESTYRASFKSPPSNDTPKYCSPENIAEVHRANHVFACKGVPPPGYPMYCLEGGRPPDPRPMFDHMSTYGADFEWNINPRFKILGGKDGREGEVGG